MNRCIKCGKPIGKTMAYCDEHRCCAEQDDKIIEDAPLELLFSLIEGVFERAKIDYVLNSEGERSEAEWFLRSEWAQTLSLSGYDPDKLIEMLDEEIADGLEEY